MGNKVEVQDGDYIRIISQSVDGTYVWYIVIDGKTKGGSGQCWDDKEDCIETQIWLPISFRGITVSVLALLVWYFNTYFLNS